MNTLPNSIHLQCCTTTTASASSNSEHYSMNIHKNPINELLNESKQQLNPYATTGIFQQSLPQQIYQPPWLDHHPVTPYNCIHCTSHPHTPSSIRTTLRSPPSNRQINNNNSNLNVPQLQSSNPIMINSLGGETMTTSWASSTDDNNTEKSNNKQEQTSSDGSIFSDADRQQQEEHNTSPLVNFERGPSFLIPTA